MDTFKVFLTTLLALMGIGVLGYSVIIMVHFPIFDFAFTDIVWTREWLYLSLVDYYAVVFCFSTIVLATEPLIIGFLWVLGFFSLGSWVLFAYLIYRVQYKSIALMKHDYFGRMTENEFEMANWDDSDDGVEES